MEIEPGAAVANRPRAEVATAAVAADVVTTECCNWVCISLSTEPAAATEDDTLAIGQAVHVELGNDRIACNVGARTQENIQLMILFIQLIRAHFGYEKPNSKARRESCVFREKISQCRKKLKGGTLWHFPTSILTQKKMKGDPLGGKKIPEKSLAVPKKMEGGPFGLAGYGMLRGKTGKTFLVQFARPNSAIWCNNIL